MTHPRETSAARILIVEDNKRLARFLARAFREEGYVVDQIASGAGALQQVQAIAYNLVILDWMLPELDGLSICREVRNRGIKVPIMILSGRTDTQERIAGLDGGADDFLTKPFDLGELLARSRALLRRGAGSSLLRAGPLSIARSERRATIDGQSLALTHTEFKLLEFLAMRSGTSVSRAKILTHVWESTSDINSNVIEVQIRNIRDKLGKFAPMLQTVRGAGYRLVPPKANQPSDPSPGDPASIPHLESDHTE